MRPLLLTILLLPLAGCALVGGDSRGPVTDLEDARDRWEALDWADYDLRLFRGCFCLGAGDFELWIRDDSLVAVHPVEDRSTEVRSSEWHFFPTVDGLFDLIERAHAEADVVTVTYDDHGWPKQIDIDWYAQAVDDEITYQVQDVEPADPADHAVLAPGDRLIIGDWSVRFEGVEEDSRCPTRVECVTAGRAVARFTVSAPDTDGPIVVDLVEGALRADDREAAEVGTRRLILLAVTPYPEDPEQPIAADDYRARILVESL